MDIIADYIPQQPIRELYYYYYYNYYYYYMGKYIYY